ncbi:MAG: hypothetical protein J6X65_09685 [Bacteroidales bacterium]|nr:hypothetical protein [Bacteroidales bacterium]
MKFKTIITLLVALSLSMTITKVFAANDQHDSLGKESVIENDSPNVQKAAVPQSNLTDQDNTQQQKIDKEKICRDNISFWVTILTPFVSIIMLIVAIVQLSKQRSDSKMNSKSTNKLLGELKTLIDSQEKNAIKAQEDRLRVLGGLKQGVGKINSQIFNNVLTDIAIKKQEIHASCSEICFYFRRNPNILKEGFATQQDDRVLTLINHIENSISTLEEMFICYGFYNDNSKSSFNGLTTVIERLKNETGIAPTRERREAYLTEITTAENRMMETVNSTIEQKRNLIKKTDE